MNILNKVIGVASLAVVLVPLPARAEWVLVGTTLTSESFYVDDDSIKHDGNYVAFWRRGLSHDPADGSGVDVLQVTNCSTGESVDRQVIMFRDGGKVFYKHKYTDKELNFKPLTYGTVSESIYNFVCR